MSRGAAMKYKATKYHNKMDERQRQVLRSLSSNLIEESDTSRNDAPEIVERARTRRTLRRMPLIAPNSAPSSSHSWLKSPVTEGLDFACGFRDGATRAAVRRQTRDCKRTLIR